MTTLIGIESATATNYSFQNAKVGFRFQCSTSGNLDTIHMFTRYSTASSSTMYFAIYSDNSGAPNALLGYTSGVAIPASDTWISAPMVSNIDITSGTYYWLAATNDNSSQNYRYERSAGATNQRASLVDLYPFLDPYGTPTYGDYAGAIYGTGTESSPTNPSVNIGDTWKEIDFANSSINIGDTWKAIAGVAVNIGDTWKTVYGSP